MANTIRGDEPYPLHTIRLIVADCIPPRKPISRTRSVIATGMQNRSCTR